MILGMTYKEVFYLILFIVFVIYISTPRKPRVRLGDVLMKYLPCTEADKVNLIKWIIVLKAGIPKPLPSLTFKGDLAFCIHVADIIGNLFDDVTTHQSLYPTPEVFLLKVKDRTTMFPIPIKFECRLIKPDAIEALESIVRHNPRGIHWPVKVEEGPDGPVIYHQGEL